MTERSELRGTVLRQGLSGFFTEVRVVPQTASTNADVAAAARSGVAEGLVLIAESQTAGRGRLDRRWEAPPRSAITLSVLLRPDIAPARMGWLPLLAGVALVEGIERVTGVDAALKWPNDLLVRAKGEGGEYGKCAGILAEVVGAEPGVVPGPGVVVGIGLNVSQRADELPAPVSGPPPTSLALSGAESTDREALVLAVLGRLADWYRVWYAADGHAAACGLLTAYRDYCVTLGREVSVSMPGGGTIDGSASDIDADGRLLVVTDDGVRPLAAGDVRHVR
jgi:BirA family transcriptional regulator, biotin operon repressor / biotin---[acetyl-CoA-carboxylase] ligase